MDQPTRDRKTAQELCDRVNTYMEREGYEPISVVPQEIQVRVGKGELGPQTRTWYQLTDSTSMPYTAWVAESDDEHGFVVSESVDGEY
jgi:hypothetical protein